MWMANSFSSVTPAPPGSTRCRAGRAMLLFAIRTPIPGRRHFRPTRSVVLLYLRWQRLRQAQLTTRNHVDASRIAQRFDLQPQFRIQRARLCLRVLQILQLKTQIDAAEVLVDVHHEEDGHEGPQPGRSIEAT